MWLRRFWVIPGLLFLVFSCVDQQEPAAAYADATTVDTVDHWQSVLDTVLALYEADELSAAMDTALAYLDESVTATWAPTASLGMLWHRLGVFYYLIDDYDEAEPAFRSAIAVREAVLGPETAEVAISYHNLGVVYKEKGNFRAAIPALEQAASIRQSIGENDRLGRTYQELGIVCNSLGDYDQARSFHQAALPLLTEAYGAEHRYTARSYFNLGTLLRKLGRYEEALEALSEAERIYRSLYGEVHAELASCYNNFGNIYDDLGNYPVAMVAYERSLAINLELEGSESMEVAENYNNLGLTCLQQGDLARARQYQEQSLTIRQQQLSTFHPRMANTLHNLAEIFTVEGRLDSALHYEQLALLHKFTNFRDSSRLALPDWETHTVAGSSVELLEILFAKARIWQLRSEQSRQRDDLLAGLATYRSCDQLIDRMRREYTSDESVLFLLDQAVPIYEGALEVVFALQGGAPAEDYTEAAFRFMEKSKSVLLLSSLKENQARMAANMPDSLLQRENELRADLAYRQRQLVDRELEYGANDSLAQVQRQQLLRRQQAYQALIGELEKDYPNYHREKYNTAVVRLDTFRQHLAGQGQSLVEYFVGARHWYYLALSATGQQFGRLADPDGLTMAVSDCLEAIHAPERGEASLREYARLGQELYDQLWSPMTANLQPRTVVVPAGILGYLPFEALLREAVGDASLRDFPFLLRDYQLSYAYSATVLMENHRSPVRRAAESVLAMAPVFADDPAWATLPYSQEEVEHIHRLVGGEMVVAEEATKAYFQAHGPAYRILHLSSHAAADSSGAGSWIAFAGPTDQQLFLPELYAMDLPADLAVLSACETGLGRISGGEGVMSLARGFAFAGCQSVITTLWKVNHGATAQIMTQLYEGLAAGATKDDALRQAQLAYLDDPTLDDIGRHPYYWSAFHQIGNANAIQLERRHPYLWWSLGGILLLLAALWLLRRRV